MRKLTKIALDLCLRFLSINKVRKHWNYYWVFKWWRNLVLLWITLEYRLIGGFVIIRGREEGVETFPKINNRGIGIMGEGVKMTQKLFWYQFNKGRTKCCHILKVHKFSLMIYNYMDISSSLMLIFFRFLCVLF